MEETKFRTWDGGEFIETEETKFRTCEWKPFNSPPLPIPKLSFLPFQ